MEDMNGFEIVKKSKEKLDSDIPVFNIFAEEMPKNEIEKIYNIAGRKFNAIISEEQYQFEVPFILEQYKEYKEYKKSKEQGKNISPGRFLDVFVGYLNIQKNQEIFF